MNGSKWSGRKRVYILLIEYLKFACMQTHSTEFKRLAGCEIAFVVVCLFAFGGVTMYVSSFLHLVGYREVHRG